MIESHKMLYIGAFHPEMNIFALMVRNVLPEQFVVNKN